MRTARRRTLARRLRRGAVLGLALLLPLAACAHAPRGQAAAPPVVFVERDTAWSGEVPVDGIVYVRKGATLSIRPGTRVLFSSRRFPRGDEHEGFAGAGIRVEGRILAEGTAEEPVVFSVQGAKPAPGSWDKIFLSFSAANRFDHCVFEGARYALHAHFSEIAVASCVFRDNEEGVRLGASRVRIADSVFTRNVVRGINFRECRNEIVRNLVYGNGDGIFLHSKDSASLIRENAIYGNRGYDLRLGDLHADDVDVGRNWWGTAREEEALRKVYDGRAVAGIGNVTIAPVLAKPPVGGAVIRGVFAFNLLPVEGAAVRAYLSIESGFGEDGAAASATTDENGVFRLSVPPGRYYVVGRADSSAGPLFAFPGRNPVAVDYGETADLGLPAVVAPPRVAPTASPSARPSIAVRATLSGKPEEGVAVQAFRSGAPDFRGAGEAQGLTNADGTAALYLPPGRYHLAAKKRMTGASIGMVEEGGLFGVYPYSPVELPPGATVSVEIPLFEKRGFLAEDERSAARRAVDLLEGAATLGGRPAEGYVVYFYRAPETIGRPAARSSIVSASGRFGVALADPGDYLAYLRRAIVGAPGSAEEERVGPVSVRAGREGLSPSTLHFPAAKDSR